ncbi:MerR family transcriptional regulator [Acetivibrio mesophilus]|uniref:MerR family transcriptional regulator n=1 Tax=Acetivibrio mesophilus TaxID=2487273 RepID=A0A4V1K2L2_9FIRM|nr:MerR family transcriptional regulator [Acetivibrio mesophilus]ODM26266.1 MerR family transcriptional regulator [Clostridium sp. Bc-iso-3]RXE60679.1 MerR family transcriptional regulator [Acetivibrio mesophilus]HHV28090.1 MerR family transcriptional regulator [Clostridium sp.]
MGETALLRCILKVGDIIENTYTTSQIAKIIGIHPNTVRMYEELELISKPLRRPNGYRVFTDIHIYQFKIARTAFQIEVLQNGLRKRIIEVVKLSANKQYDKAIQLTHQYIQAVKQEIDNANEAVEITKELLQGLTQENTVFLTRKEVSTTLGVTMDTLRNWEMNGLLKVKRSENGYRVYSNEDIQKLKIIRSLRCANYSLSAILRMMNTITQNPEANIEQLLNTPTASEDIVSVYDKLIVSLNMAKENAEIIIDLLHEMKSKYSNPPV